MSFRRKLDPNLVFPLLHDRSNRTHRHPDRRRDFVFVEEHRQLILVHLLFGKGTLLIKMAALPGTVVTFSSFAGSPTKGVNLNSTLITAPARRPR
jgi:hypothetical protein